MLNRFIRNLSKKFFKPATGNAARKPIKRRLEVEALESRELMAAGLSANLSQGILADQGAYRADTVQLTGNATGQHKLNGSQIVGNPTFGAKEEIKALGHGRRASDTFQSIEKVRVDKRLDGTRGHHHLVGGQGKHATSGGPGLDRLIHGQTPVAKDDSYRVYEDHTFSWSRSRPIMLLLARQEAPGNGVLFNDLGSSTAVLLSGPSHGKLELDPNGDFTYTPDANFTGTDSFSYQAKDSDGNLSDRATVTITVLALRYRDDGTALRPAAESFVGLDLETADQQFHALRQVFGNRWDYQFQIAGGVETLEMPPWNRLYVEVVAGKVTGAHWAGPDSAGFQLLFLPD